MLQQRVSGILLPIASLPGKDIGNFGAVAFRFLKDCVATGQRVWQVLPIGPTIVHDSPFYSPSAFAISHNYIDVENLTEGNFRFLTRDEVADYFRKFDGEHPNRINYGLLWEQKKTLLRKAYARFVEQGGAARDLYAEFLREESHWLDEYAEFMAIKEIHLSTPGKETWSKWEGEFKDRRLFKKRLAEFAQAQSGQVNPAGWDTAQVAVYREIEKQADFHRFLQWIALGQWRRLKKEAEQNGIHIIGDCPIYVAPDSADVWANREVFKLDENGDQLCYAGVPPDYFSPKYGQFWGNPIYRWFGDHGEINVAALDWWTRRLQHQFELFDEVRIDHFRGFAGYWEIPREECETTDEKGKPVKTAKHGKWLPGPGEKLFAYVAGQLRKTERELPIIAEDLGVITTEVTELRKLLDAPGMGVFQFAPYANLYCRTGNKFSEWTEEVRSKSAPDNPKYWKRFYYRGENKYLPFLRHEFLPRNARKTGKLVFYPGTHDNETLVGWYENPDRTALEREMFLDYLNHSLRCLFADDKDLEFYLNQPLHWKVIRLLSASSDIRYAIFQMQDVLGLPNEDAAAAIQIRTNRPNHTGQWRWKMGGEHEFTEPVRAMLASITTQNHRK